MTDELEPGAQGVPLPPNIVVARLMKLPPGFLDDPAIVDSMFTLSGPDKESDLKALSAFVQSLTTIEQLRVFRKFDDIQLGLVILLNTDVVRGIRPANDSDDRQYLDVVWDPLLDEQTGEPDQRPGAKGHCGITGLDEVRTPNKAERTKLRIRLARAINARKDYLIHPKS